jgi:hypothetical protein
MQQDSIQGFRLSPQQRHLWLLQRCQDTLPYRAQCAALIEGNLHIARLRAAIGRVAGRHEILRTTFRCLPGMLVPLHANASRLGLRAY